VQTFLPLPDFQLSASTLDMRRLGKQRVETKQIYLALTQPTYGWKNHPAVKMWRGHEAALLAYGLAMCSEWTGRGYKDTMTPWFSCEFGRNKELSNSLPSWFGNNEFHLAHQSKLISKNPKHYLPLFPDAPHNLPYIWPV